MSHHHLPRFDFLKPTVYTQILDLIICSWAICSRSVSYGIGAITLTATECGTPRPRDWKRNRVCTHCRCRRRRSRHHPFVKLPRAWTSSRWRCCVLMCICIVFIMCFHSSFWVYSAMTIIYMHSYIILSDLIWWIFSLVPFGLFHFPQLI
ncbi:hypothetical protein GGU10DRAFT_109840 [Lentinula aff. detonsa]|uniref:Uncharacterized protein n=1 Tax=Lentinula aff. detonsa TaxID=2804958 RepID=A0AA38L3C5_9AGAR|nr:hypothetical protein GGU10DRAFT_109840 [Lentinula aff. detonsa]